MQELLTHLVPPCRCSGRIDIELTPGEGGALQHAAARVDLQPLQFQLQPDHPALLAHLATCIRDALPPQTVPQGAFTRASPHVNRPFLLASHPHQ